MCGELIDSMIELSLREAKGIFLVWFVFVLMEKEFAVYED